MPEFQFKIVGFIKATRNVKIEADDYEEAVESLREGLISLERGEDIEYIPEGLHDADRNGPEWIVSNQPFLGDLQWEDDYEEDAFNADI